MSYHTKSQLDAKYSKIVGEFLANDFTSLAPDAYEPILVDMSVNPPVASVGDVHNYNAFFNTVNEVTVLGTGKEPVRRDILSAITLELYLKGRFRCRTQVQSTQQAPVVEAKKELSANDLNNKRVSFERLLNDRNTSPIRGAAVPSTKKPATKEELVSAAEADAAENQAAANVISLIRNHTGKSHGASAAEKQILTGIFDEAKAAGKTFVQIQDAIMAQKSIMQNWNAQEAIRRVYEGVTRKKGLTLSERSADKYKTEVY